MLDMIQLYLNILIIEIKLWESQGEIINFCID